MFMVRKGLQNFTILLNGRLFKYFRVVIYVRHVRVLDYSVFGIRGYFRASGYLGFAVHYGIQYLGFQGCLWF